MNKSDLINTISDRFPTLVQQDAEDSVKVILSAIADTLKNNGRVEIRGFGVFALNYRPPRQARNPKTGQALHVEAKYSPHFRAGKELREAVDASASFSPIAQ